LIDVRQGAMILRSTIRPLDERLMTVIIHRFEEIIGGRSHEIEVTPAGARWRAQLRRRPGTPTAMMPFYGETPEEAARRLAEWLTLAHNRRLRVQTA
jgi:hypothetical protein